MFKKIPIFFELFNSSLFSFNDGILVLLLLLFELVFNKVAFSFITLLASTLASFFAWLGVDTTGSCFMLETVVAWGTVLIGVCVVSILVATVGTILEARLAVTIGNVVVGGIVVMTWTVGLVTKFISIVFLSSGLEEDDVEVEIIEIVGAGSLLILLLLLMLFRVEFESLLSNSTFGLIMPSFFKLISALLCILMLAKVVLKGTSFLVLVFTVEGVVGVFSVGVDIDIVVDSIFFSG